MEMRQSSFNETVGNAFATHSLLTHTPNHLTQIHWITLGSAERHYQRFVASVKVQLTVLSDSLPDF